jgi:hypothetical protein
VCVCTFLMPKIISNSNFSKSSVLDKWRVLGLWNPWRWSRRPTKRRYRTLLVSCMHASPRLCDFVLEVGWWDGLMLTIRGTNNTRQILWLADYMHSKNVPEQLLTVACLSIFLSHF